jgi:hypothetical protein
VSDLRLKIAGKIARCCALACVLSVPILVVAKVCRVLIFASNNIVHSPPIGMSAKFKSSKPPPQLHWDDLRGGDVVVEVGSKSHLYHKDADKLQANMRKWKESGDVPEYERDGKKVPALPPYNFPNWAPAQLVGYGFIDRFDDVSFWHVVAAAVLGGTFLLHHDEIMKLWAKSNRKYLLIAVSTLSVWTLFGASSLWQQASDHGPIWGAYWTSSFDAAVRWTQWIDETIFQLVAVCAGIIAGIFATVLLRRQLADRDKAPETICTLINAFVTVMVVVATLVSLNATLAHNLVPVIHSPIKVIGASWPIFAIGVCVVGIGWIRLSKSGIEYTTWTKIPLSDKLSIPVPWFSIRPN